ncbi:MAG: glycosyltransferase [Nitrospirales bacterium]
MNILIIEPFVAGHHGVYLQWMVRALISKGHQVQIGTFKESLQHSTIQAMLSSQDKNISFITSDFHKYDTSARNPFKMIHKMIKFRAIFQDFYKRAIQNARVDFVMVPYLDYCTYAFAILGSPFARTPWAGLVMRAGFHHSAWGVKAPPGALDSIKERLFFRLLRNSFLRALFTIDVTLKEYTESLSLPQGVRLVFIPDSTETKCSMSQEQARHKLGISKHGFIVLVYGSLSLRKGIEVLMRATEDGNFPSEGHLLFAGKQDEEVERFLLSSLSTNLNMRGRIHQINRFLSMEEESMVFSAADVVWLGYQGHYHMSGVLVQAGVMGLPVLACEEGLIGSLTNRFTSGIVVSSSSPSAIAKAIGELSRNEKVAQQYGENARLAYASHNLENFSRILVDAIEERH